MNPPANELKRSSMRLLPHQATFVETVLDPASKRTIVLRGDVGLGKGAALVALANRLLREQPAARVLLLVPGSALRAQFVERLREAGTPTLPVDRYQFREMLDSTTGGEFWPAGIVAVLSREFARQQDIRNALATARWDLLIVHEAHQFRGTLGRDVVRQVGDSSDRIVLATLPNLELPDDLPEDSVTVVEWRRDKVVDYDGRPLDLLPRPLLHEVHYSLSSAELSLAETVGELCRTLETGTAQQALIARSWLRSLQSSPAAIEARLPRIADIRNRAAHGLEPQLEVPEEEESIEYQLGGWLDLPTAEKAAAIAVRLAQKIEGLGSDSKLTALGVLLNRLEAQKSPSTRICVLTEYLATLFYVAAEIEILGLQARLLHGQMSNEDRQSALDSFSTAGAILTATRAAMSEGVAMGEVTDLVLYDVPDGKDTLQQVLGRFDRFGRQAQLNVYVLVQSDAATTPVSESHALLRRALGGPDAQTGEERSSHSEKS